MVHVIFDTNSVAYGDFIQTGGGIGGIEEQSPQYFKGTPPYLHQRGYGYHPQMGAGVSDVFRGLYRFFLPLIRRVGTTISEEALNTGQRVLERVSQGEPLKQTIVSEGKRGIDTVLDKGGLPKQFGTGRKGIKRKPESLLDHQTLIGRAVKKPVIATKRRVRSDLFGLY